MLQLVFISEWTFRKKAKAGCEFVIEHFRYNCPATPFNMSVIKIFEASGYESNKVYFKAGEIIIERELLDEDS